MTRLAAALLLLATPALAAHTRTTDPVAMAQPHALVTCAGDVTVPLAAAAAAGGVIHLSPGSCITAATVQLVTGAALNGEGPGVTVLRATPGLTGPVVTVGGALRWQAATGVQIWSLTIDGAAIAGAAPGVDAEGIFVRSGSSATITDVEVTGAAGNGIRFAGAGAVNHSYVHENQHGGVYVEGIAQLGLPVWPAGPVAITGNRVSGNSLARAPGSMATTGLPAWDGIDCDPWHTGCTVTGNAVVGNDILLLDRGVAGWWSGHDSVTGNTVSGSVQSGIDVAGSIDGFTVSGNMLDHDTPNAIVVGGVARNGTVTGNTAIGGGPIIIHLGTSNVTASANVLR